jgi:hypothetical protein
MGKRKLNEENDRTTIVLIFLSKVMKKSPKRSYSVIENERFGLVFAKTVSIISGRGDTRDILSLLAALSERDLSLFLNNIPVM